MRLVECRKLSKRILANDIGVEDEERRIVLAENLLSELQRTSSAEGFRLDGECDANVVLLLVLKGCQIIDSLAQRSVHLLERRSHDLRPVVHSKDNVCDTSGSQTLNLVLDHWLVAKFDERLRKSESLRAGVRFCSGLFCTEPLGLPGRTDQRSETSSKPADKNESWAEVLAMRLSIWVPEVAHPSCCKDCETVEMEEELKSD